MHYLIRYAGLLFLAAAVPALGAADAPPADELLKLEGPALFKAADDVSLFDNPYAVDELIAVAAKLADEFKSLPREDPDHSRYAFNKFFEEACGKANDRQLDQLIQIYRRLDPTSFEKDNDLPALAAAWIHRELRAHGEKTQFKLPDHDVAPPGELKSASKDLVAAWRLYKRAMEAYEKAFPEGSVENPINFQANNRAFFSIVEDLLVGRGKGATEKILNYAGGPRSLAVFMSLLHERRLAEAIGACLLVSGDQLTVEGEDKVDVRIEFLEACGLDWEGILAGAQTDAECRGFYAYVEFSSREPLLAELAGYGTGRSALLLAELARRAKPDRHEAYANALAALVEKNPAKPGECPGYESLMSTFSSDSIERVAKVRIPPAVQKELIGIVQAFVTATTTRDVAAPALTMFARARARETIPALRSLLKHPSADVSRDAAAILCAMGEKVEADATTKAGPVRFKILINGESLPMGFKGTWDVEWKSGSVHDVAADNGGAFTIPREHFLDPNKPPTGVGLHSAVSQSPDLPWFDLYLPAPRDLDAVPPVDAKVFRANLSLENLSRLHQPAGATVSVKIRKERIGEESTSSYPEFEPRTIEGATEGPIDLPLLQRGRYHLEVEVSGAARWSQEVELAPAAPQVTAWFEPGSDVRIKVTGTGIDEEFSSFHLLKDGAESESPFDNKSRTYKGLPCGNYVLHIPSSEDLRKDDIMDYQPGPDEIAYAGRDIAFVISEGSPATIDLGEIHLETLPK